MQVGADAVISTQGFSALSGKLFKWYSGVPKGAVPGHPSGPYSGRSLSPGSCPAASLMLSLVRAFRVSLPDPNKTLQSGPKTEV